ncbi:PfkB family carbohydrate kinase [Actinoallomurus sp. CA-142502]|uniref:PfkB family carbohydrate kinase n=1 Tax=Actinoallomurus sp. CA-142502 TaxID=3239885 RepID=UPI003D8D2FB8
MGPLGVIGNISRDISVYADGRHYELLGGAALHVARAAAAAGLSAAPVSVIGTDLAPIHHDPRLTGLDLTAVHIDAQPSCVFRLAYTADGDLDGIECEFGAAMGLTEHALTVVDRYASLHVCCRRPLDVARVLRRLAAAGRAFSVDFHLASAQQLIQAAAEALPQARVVFVNAVEFTTLTNHIEPSQLANLVVSNGPRQATLLRYGRPVATAQPPPGPVVEVTGAGDALAGAFLAHLAHGKRAEEALPAAVAAASQTTRHADLNISTDGSHR